ncbi:MAG: hypothetical protein LKF96_09005 [Treponema sp.]|nr:hypothetical protein [Treponema sp.]
MRERTALKNRKPPEILETIFTISDGQKPHNKQKRIDRTDGKIRRQVWQNGIIETHPL